MPARRRFGGQGTSVTPAGATSNAPHNPTISRPPKVSRKGSSRGNGTIALPPAASSRIAGWIAVIGCNVVGGRWWLQHVRHHDPPKSLVKRMTGLRRTSALAFVIGLLAACGGSGDVDLAEAYELHVVADLSENHMTQRLLEGQLQPCNSLILSFIVASRSKLLPPDLTAVSVSLSKASAERLNVPVSRSEVFRSGDNKLYGVARACRTDSFLEGDFLDAHIEVASRDSRAILQTLVRLQYSW